MQDRQLHSAPMPLNPPIPVMVPEHLADFNCLWIGWDAAAVIGAHVEQGTPLCKVRAKAPSGEVSEMQIHAPCAGVISMKRGFELGQAIDREMVLLHIGQPATRVGGSGSEDPYADLPDASESFTPTPTSDPARTVQPGETSRAIAKVGGPSMRDRAANADMRPKVPGYHLLERLGMGASGAVYRAIEIGTPVECALKVFHERSILDQEWKRTEMIKSHVPPRQRGKFVLLERRIDADGLHVARMPLEPSKSLDQIIEDLRERSKGGPTPSQVRAFVLGLCRAVGRLHAQQIYHRDIKPSNVFVSIEDADDHVEVKISDFTVCYSPRMDRGRAHHVNLNRAGTMEYLPPEARRQSPPPPDERVDIYSIGMVAYEFACLRKAALGAPEPSVLRSDPGFEWLDEVFRRAIANDVADRARSTAELIELVRGESATSLPPGVGGAPRSDLQGDELLSKGRLAASFGRNEEAESCYRRAGQSGDVRAWLALADLTWRSNPASALEACEHVIGADAVRERDLETATSFRAVLTGDRATLSQLVARDPTPMTSMWNDLLEQFDVVELPIPAALAGEVRWKRVSLLPWKIRHRESAVDMILVVPDGDEKVHPPYYLGMSAVTQGQWRRVMPLPIGLAPAGDSLPVNAMSWRQASAFAASIGLRLPTSEEWEIACRAGTRSMFSCGGTLLPSHGNCDRDGAFSKARTSVGVTPTLAPAVSGQANPWGFLHMHGNVWEWCADEVADRPGYRIRRGGSYADPPSRCESTSIDSGPEDREGWVLVGLRVAWSPPTT